MKIVCVGDCGVDHYLPANDRLFGGISANFARHARREFRAEDTVHLVSVVGDDDGGDIVMAALETSGIDCHVTRLTGNTPVQYIEVQPDGERRFVRYDEGVLRDFALQESDRNLIAGSDLLVAPVYLQIVGLFDELMSIQTAGKVAIDFADFLQHPDFGLLEKYVGRIDIGFFGLASSDNAMIERLQQLAKEYATIFVVTLGADGAIVLSDDAVVKCSAVPVNEVVDTTGAGDAFAAGFLSHYCHGGTLASSTRKGAGVAAGVIQYLGAFQPANPSDNSRPV